MKSSIGVSNQESTKHLNDVGSCVRKPKVYFLHQGQVPAIYIQVPVVMDIDKSICWCYLNFSPCPKSIKHCQSCKIEQNHFILFVYDADELLLIVIKYVS